jgi:pimeloyl-ACP methyl ester carboxylesterase
VGHTPPLLIANGFAPFPLPLHVAKEFFGSRGREVRIVPFRLANKRDVVRYARSVAEEVRRAATIAGPVDVIGFSMGGAATLYAVKRLDIGPYVRTFVALAAPFRGSTVAWLGWPTRVFAKVGAQLRPGSSFLEALHEGPLPPGPRYVAIAGEHDVICPPETALIDGFENVTGPFGHKDFLLKEEVHALIERYLD